MFLVLGLSVFSIPSQAAEYFLDNFDDANPPGNWTLTYAGSSVSKTETNIDVVGGTRHTAMPSSLGAVVGTNLSLTLIPDASWDGRSGFLDHMILLT